MSECRTDGYAVVILSRDGSSAANCNGDENCAKVLYSSGDLCGALCDTAGAVVTLIDAVCSLPDSAAPRSLVLRCGGADSGGIGDSGGTRCTVLVRVEATVVLLVLIEQSRMSHAWLSEVMRHIHDAIVCQYGCLLSCLSSTNVKQQLDDLLCGVPSLFDPGVPSLTCTVLADASVVSHVHNGLSVEARLFVEECASYLNTVTYHRTRERGITAAQCFVIGSALFCDGVMLSCHLSSKHAANVHSMLVAAGMLQSGRSQRHLVRWLPYYQCSGASPGGATCFLVVVIEAQYIVCLLVELLPQHCPRALADDQFDCDIVVEMENVLDDLLEMSTSGMQALCARRVARWEASEHSVASHMPSTEVTPDCRSRDLRDLSESLSHDKCRVLYCTRSVVVLMACGCVVCGVTHDADTQQCLATTELLTSAILLCQTLTVAGASESAMLVPPPAGSHNTTRPVWLIARMVCADSLRCVCVCIGEPPENTLPHCCLDLIFSTYASAKYDTPTATHQQPVDC